MANRLDAIRARSRDRRHRAALPEKVTVTLRPAERESQRKFLSEFDMAFALMSVIPLLICCYLLAAKFFSLSIFVGLNGIYFLLATGIAVLGLVLGRQITRRVIQELVEARAEAEWLLDQLVGTDEQLDRQRKEHNQAKDALEHEEEAFEDLHRIMLRRERKIIELRREIEALRGQAGPSPDDHR